MYDRLLEKKILAAGVYLLTCILNNQFVLHLLTSPRVKKTSATFSDDVNYLISESYS
jgi:hypothetical protein